MSRKKERVVKHPAAVEAISDLKPKKWFFSVFVLLLAAIPFGIGKYIEFNSPGAFDCGAYVYSAQHILQGATLGVDEMPSAQIGTLLMNILGVWMFGFRDIGPKLVQAILQAAALLTLFFTFKKVFGWLAAVISLFIASAYLSAPLIAKYGNVKEQFMVSFAMLGVCMLIVRHSGGSWRWGLLSGIFLIWPPLFKETGFAVLGGVGLFVVFQPILKNRTWRQTAVDIGLLLGGAAITLIPIFLWLIIRHQGNFLPFAGLVKYFSWGGGQAAGNLGGSYIGNARSLIDFATYAGRIIRYYELLMLPIALASGSILLRAIRAVMCFRRSWRLDVKPYEKFVLLLGVWWILDMAFVWISPRSYEEYYIPLNASAAMLSAYLMARYADRFSGAVFKGKWVITGLVGFLLMIAMSFHIFFGITKSPHSNQPYGERQRGYTQRLDEIKLRKTKGYIGSWETAGKFIRQHSTPADTIFVWGWVPGIYVEAQRLSPTTKPFTSEMHVISPAELQKYVDEIMDDFKKEKPLFVVDTHNRHFPWDRPPLELWPTTSKGLLPNELAIISQYEQQYGQMLGEKVSADEAMRFEAMKVFRDFIMTHYRPVQSFGEMVVFELKKQG